MIFNIKNIILAATAANTLVYGVNIHKRKDDIVKEAGQWKKFELNLSAGRSRMGAASAGDYALFAGGLDKDGKDSGVVDIYNIVSKSMTNSSLSEKRSEIGAGSFLKNRYAVFAGGITSSLEVSKQIDIFDSQTNEWKVLEMCEPRISPKIFDIGGLLVIYGGVLTKPPYISNAIDYLDSDFKLTCSQQNVFPFPMNGLGAGNQVLSSGVIMSGYKNIDPNNKFSSLVASNQTLHFTKDVNSNQVTLRAVKPLPEPRWGISGAISFDILVYAGGYTTDADGQDTIQSDKVSGYNTRRDLFSDYDTKLKEPRSYIYAGAFQRFVLFWGGGASRVLDVFNNVNKKMISDNLESLYLNQARFDAASTVVNECMMFVAGGNIPGSGTPTDLIEVIDAC
ncbi:hypothetical protein AYI69_g2826 [Smittium culicis]|uniref:Uncharacterized protein n=1 Tax=Smittium culicis TaxID=133412 RepID=A0A1R1YLB2_9FUNG|nr:hypothetical protein AYI69_g2826 [Smittium culicis]